MKIVCDSCGAKYSIADEKVAGKIFKIRCKKCSSVLEVRGDQTGAHPFSDGGAGQEPSGEATWYIVVDGEQKGPLPPIELSRLFAKGSVGLDSYVWKEGFDDWKAASDVPELTEIFGGAASQGGTAGSDDTSSFGTSGDLFTEGGREPTSEIDTESGMFAGFDESPTPTNREVDESPLAASASADAGGAMAGAGLGGGAMAGASPQRMTGQRNENSVLFSLSNLQQLAGRGGAAEPAPAPVSQPAAMSAGANAPQAAGEGSGLIDIRALAKSTTPGTQAAPTQAVDDLLAIGTGGGASTLGTPLLGPAPLETSDSNRWLWIAGAAVAVIAIVGAGVGVGIALGGSDDEALEIAAPAVQEAQPQPGGAAMAAAAPSEQAPQPEAEPQEAAVVDIEPEEPVAAATLEEPSKPSTRQRTAPKKRSSSERRQQSARAKQEPKQATPKRKSNNLDALMDEVVGGKSTSSSSKPKQRSAASSPSTSGLPDAPSRTDVKTALQGVSGAVKACRKDAGGVAAVAVTFSGKTGRAAGAKVASGPFKGTPVGSCIEAAVKRARVPRFKQSSFKVTFPYRL